MKSTFFASKSFLESNCNLLNLIDLAKIDTWEIAKLYEIKKAAV
jgi:hypothetical protein